MRLKFVPHPTFPDKYDYCLIKCKETIISICKTTTKYFKEKQEYAYTDKDHYISEGDTYKSQIKFEVYDHFKPRIEAFRYFKTSQNLHKFLEQYNEPKNITRNIVARRRKATRSKKLSNR